MMRKMAEVRRALSQKACHRPDQGGGFISFAPRVLMHAADLPATELIQPASRVNYRMALVGAPQAVQGYADWARAEIDKTKAQGVRLQTLEGT